jgi:hypothetical protein
VPAERPSQLLSGLGGPLGRARHAARRCSARGPPLLGGSDGHADGAGVVRLALHDLDIGQAGEVGAPSVLRIGEAGRAAMLVWMAVHVRDMPVALPRRALVRGLKRKLLLDDLRSALKGQSHPAPCSRSRGRCRERLLDTLEASSGARTPARKARQAWCQSRPGSWGPV